jgi:proteasome lid subunit RPN8/RPN11
MIQLPADLITLIRAEGEKAYPAECCGILLGKIQYDDNSRIAEEIMPIDNAREKKDQHNRFLIEDRDLMQAELYARRQGREVLGFYHSHPDHPAKPSEYDRQHALPYYSYVIVAVKNGEAAELTSWELLTDRTRFVQEI